MHKANRRFSGGDLFRFDGAGDRLMDVLGIVAVPWKNSSADTVHGKTAS
ncbi:MAG: hypothetical protein IJ461_09760 [Clostridia bacterium]|nr:hypothetical protein [Clostridia bacterium]